MQPLQKTVFYGGTFDPPHNGHLSALLSAMKKTGATRAVIWADRKANPYKPNRTNWEFRVEMLKKMFESFNDIFVFNNWEHLRLTIQKDHVIFLIGSDTWPRCREKPVDPHFKEVCVSVRENDPPPNCIYPIPVSVVVPPITNCSSTKVREAFSKNSSEASTLLKDALPQSVQQFIQDRLLYVDDATKKERIKTRVLQVLEKTLKWNNVHLKLLNEGRNNISGDYPFKVTVDKQVYFAKAFYAHEKLRPEQRLNNEMMGSYFLQKRIFNVAKGANIIHSYLDHDKGWGLIVTEFSPLKELAEFTDITSIEKAYYLVGKALKEIHSRQKIAATSAKFAEKIKPYDNRMEECFKSLGSRLQSIEVDFLRAIYKNARQRFEKQQGELTFIHGDANAGNFLVDLEKETVVIVDLSTFECGYPGRDAQQVMAGLYYQQVVRDISEEYIDRACVKFLEGYQYQDLITEEAWEFFDIYWKIRIINSYLGTMKSNLHDKAETLIKCLIAENCKV